MARVVKRGRPLGLAVVGGLMFSPVVYTVSDSRVYTYMARCWIGGVTVAVYNIL